jgi:hypothetical protein
VAKIGLSNTSVAPFTGNGGVTFDNNGSLTFNSNGTTAQSVIPLSIAYLNFATTLLRKKHKHYYPLLQVCLIRIRIMLHIAHKGRDS